MKATCILFSLLGGALASAPNKRIGTQIGDLLSANSGNADFQKAYESQILSSMPAVVNSQVSEAIRATNKKMSSFLKVPSNINLHIVDSSSYAQAASKHLEYQQRSKLMQILKKSASDKEKLANLMASKQSFLSAPLADSQFQSGQIDQLQSGIRNYIGGIRSGGYTAQRALAGLSNLMSTPNGKIAGQMASPVLLSALRDLMLRESTPDQMRIAAGSIITELTNIPVASSAVDTATGGYGHETIVLPSPSRVYGADREMLALQAGSKSFLQKQVPFKLPEELVGDVNKSPYPTVNVIADVNDDAESEEVLKSMKYSLA